MTHKYDFTTVMDRSHMGSVKWFIMKRANPNVPEGIVPFSVADMEFANAPEIIQAIKDFMDDTKHNNLAYAFEGMDGYLQSVCNWQKKRFAWETKPEWVVTTHGVVPAFTQMIRLLCQPGDDVLVLGPAYGPFYTGIKSSQCNVVESPLVNRDGRYEIDFADLERKAQAESVKLFLLCNPHNPTGRVWSAEDLRRLAKICLDNNVFIISDEIHEDLIMPGFKHTPLPLAAPEVLEHCMVCTAPSKTFNLAGMEHSNIFIPNAELKQKFWMSWLVMGLHHSGILSFVANMAAYDKCEPWLEELLSVLVENQKCVDEFIAAKMPRMKTIPMEGTYLKWIDCRGMGIDDAALSQFCKDAMVYLDEGTQFGPEGSGFIRINLAAPTSLVTEALERLYAEYQKKGF